MADLTPLEWQGQVAGNEYDADGRGSFAAAKASTSDRLLQSTEKEEPEIQRADEYRPHHDGKSKLEELPE